MPNLGTFITWVLNFFGHRKAMIDCFEISTEKPFSVKVFVKMSSTYKHYLVFDRSSESESESALFAKCVQTHEEFVVVFKKLLVHTCIHTYKHTYLT